MVVGQTQDRRLPAVYFPVGYNDSASGCDSTPYSDSGFSTPGECAEYAESDDSTGSAGSDYLDFPNITHYFANIRSAEDDAEAGAAAPSRLIWKAPPLIQPKSALVAKAGVAKATPPLIFPRESRT